MKQLIISLVSRCWATGALGLLCRAPLSSPESVEGAGQPRGGGWTEHRLGRQECRQENSAHLFEEQEGLGLVNVGAGAGPGMQCSCSKVCEVFDVLTGGANGLLFPARETESSVLESAGRHREQYRISCKLTKLSCLQSGALLYLPGASRRLNESTN